MAPRCPDCNSEATWKDGWAYPPNRKPIQRYLCRGCGCRFSEKKQNTTPILMRKQRLLMTTQPLLETAGAMPQGEIKGIFFDFLFYMKKQGYSESTIRSRGKLIRRLVNLGADLYDPESVKEVVIASIIATILVSSEKELLTS